MKSFILGLALGLILAGGLSSDAAGNLNWLTYNNQQNIIENQERIAALESWLLAVSIQVVKEVSK